MNWKEFFKPEKRKVIVFLFVIFILVLRGFHWLVEEIDLIWVPLLIVSTIILIPVGIIFWLASWIVPVDNDVVGFSNDLLLLIYPGLVLYSYFVACLIISMTKDSKRD